jgi:hypothetical protein
LKQRQKYDPDLVRFNIKPEIDLKKDLKEIKDEIISKKKVNFWIDEDDKERVTHLKIITKASLNELIDIYEMGTNVTTLAKESKYSYNRLKRLFKFYELKKWEIFDHNQ